jgi:hypothetical protein
MSSGKYVAAVVAEYWHRSHADGIVSKLLDGYEVMWLPVQPHVELDALYVDFPGPHDVSRERTAPYNVSIYSTIRDTLTRGGRGLADGVVLIGEHGGPRAGRTFEWDERGMIKDDRRSFFEETVRVFDDLGRVAPIFHDGRLGSSWRDASWLYQTARDLQIPVLATGGMPFGFRSPPLELKPGSSVEEAVAVVSTPKDLGQYNLLEVAASLLERRRGHETGVASVQYLSGEAFWEAWDSGECWSRALQEAVLDLMPHADASPRDFFERRKERAPVESKAALVPGAPHVHVAGEPYVLNTEQLARLTSHDTVRRAPPVGSEEAILIEYRDGLRFSVLALNGYIKTGYVMPHRGIALRVAGMRAPLATTVYNHPIDRPMAWCHDHVAFVVDEFLLTGRTPIPLERALLVTGIADAALTSRYLGGVRLETPHLAIEYAGPGPTTPHLPIKVTEFEFESEEVPA